MNRIGVTGGIGSGKSYVCRIIEQLGYPVYYCDDEAKRLMVESTEIRTTLTKLIGDDAYTYSEELNSYRLNKAAVAAFLFANKENGTKINSIVHPVVKQDFIRWSTKQNSNVVFQECALLFESGFEDTVDFIVTVEAPYAIRLQRAMSRDNANATQIEARMKQQMAEEEKQKRADFIIHNDGNHDITEQVKSLLSQFSIMN